MAAQTAKNLSLHRDLDAARAKLAAAMPTPVQTPKPAVRDNVATHAPIQPTSAPPAAVEFDAAAFDKAVEDRVAQREAEREERRAAEREERRRAWENETEEQREARRKEFQARAKEFADARLTAFTTEAGLDETQQSALHSELQALDSRVREIADGFATAVEDGAPFGFETQMQLLNEMSAAILDTYAGLDESLPEGWREHDDGFLIMLGISPDAGESLFRAFRHGGGFRFAPFPGRMPGPPPQAR